VSAQQHGDEAAGRIKGFLAAHDRLVPGVTRDFVSACTPTGQSHPDGPVLTRSDLHEVLRQLDDAKSAAELWEDTAMKLKNRIVGDSIHTERWHVIAAELRNLTARVEGYEATGSLRHDEDTEPDLSNEPLGEIDV
jgi:hypothetical protein